jgi:CRP/FNR family cyclic AMP-dependent transcriptional regulator
MDAEKLKFILEELHFSADLPPRVLEHLAAESKTHPVAAGAALFREGQVNDQLYLVRSGRLALEMNVPGRGAVRILTVGPGEMVGWSALLHEGKMKASAVALEDSEVIAAAADRLRELCETNHDFGFHLMRQMAGALSHRLVATRLQLLDLFAHAQTDVHTGELKAETIE